MQVGKRRGEAFERGDAMIGDQVRRGSSRLPAPAPASSDRVGPDPTRMPRRKWALPLFQSETTEWA